MSQKDPAPAPQPVQAQDNRPAPVITDYASL
ncbi:hypothetical protein ASD8599_02314 [Ascidiaceihabitans donghaensis]|uniref:Uncharacterized protein n=1 Tax=Ascidiaceihabitans donghaensis TaxID=1510460 RepID=A0A2R8BES3_9RHOB|nr:hypothetical protein ASD8599_02314 [Ascidiaceihabitans donghaensis]